MFRKKGKTVITVKMGLCKEVLEKVIGFAEKMRKVYPDADLYIEMSEERMRRL